MENTKLNLRSLKLILALAFLLGFFLGVLIAKKNFCSHEEYFINPTLTNGVIDRFA